MRLSVEELEKEMDREFDVVERANDAVADILDGEPLSTGMIFISSVFEWISEGKDRARILAEIVDAIVGALGFDFTYPPKEGHDDRD